MKSVSYFNNSSAYNSTKRTEPYMSIENNLQMTEKFHTFSRLKPHLLPHPGNGYYNLSSIESSSKNSRIDMWAYAAIRTFHLASSCTTN